MMIQKITLTKITYFLGRGEILILVLITLILPALFALTKPGFFPTQDYIYVGRLYQMDVALKDGQFPVRWAPDFRYGEPLFNFYAPLPYYAGALIHMSGLSYLNTIKVLFALNFLLSGITMFFFVRKLFGSLGAVLSAVLYVYAPYRSVDIYVRGALSEAWSFIFFPLIFLGIFNLSKCPSRFNIIFLSLSLAGLFFTHNIMTMLFLPFALGWSVYCLNQKRSLKSALFLGASFMLGFGLTASFLLPAFIEKSFVQSQYLLTGYFNFRGHFVALGQLFSTFWGYGASLWGAKDDMSFQIGITHWLALVGGTFFLFLTKKRDKDYILLWLILLGLFLFSLFMMHNKSTPIWESFSELAFVQFPWRFLGISVFLISLLGGLMGLYANKKSLLIIGSLIVAVIVLNMKYFQPESYYYDSIDEHYMSSTVLSKDDKLPKDYLPIWVKKIEDVKISLPRQVSGDMKISNFEKRSTWAIFKVDVFKEGEVEVPITYFPGWKVLVDGKEIDSIKPSEKGLIKFVLSKGNHLVTVNFTNTPIRIAGNLISLFSIIIILSLYLKSKITKNVTKG